MAQVGYPHIERDERGVLRVSEHGFKVIMLIGDHIYRGDDAGQLAHNHPPLTLAQAHMIRAYYYDHKDAIDAELEARRRQADELLSEIEARQGHDALRERLRAVKAEVERHLA